MNAVDANLDALLRHPLFAGVPTARAAGLRSAIAGVGLPRWLPQALDALHELGADADSGVAAVMGAANVGVPQEESGLADLVEGQAAEREVVALHAQHAGRNVEGLRRLLLAMAHDLRVVPIVLALRLAELRDAMEHAEPAKSLAQVVRDIHAPLANRLGVWQLKWELEDLAFRALQPADYRRIAGLLDETRREREADIAIATTQLAAALREHGIEGAISGRPKHIYSIWRKMERKQLPFEGLFDLRALRVLVDSVADCYAALGVAHALWPPVPGEFDDYIARPKHNDYRSLHTAVVGPGGKVFELQFRTHEMHRHAELGVAAHWRYKEGGAGDPALERRVVWMRRLLELQSQPEAGDPLAAELDAELAEERIYVLTPSSEVIDLPAGATPLDFAYRLHTDLGHRCRGAKVDGRIVALDTPLRTGQRVEIMAGKEAEPRRDWLLPGNRYLASGRSREKVRSWFRRLDRARNEQVGREMLERELRRAGLLRASLEPVLARFQLSNAADLHVRLALGELGPTQVSRVLSEAEKPPPPPKQEPDKPVPRTAERRRRGTPGVAIGGVGNVLSQVARCCQPVAGEPAVGYLSRAHHVSVHRRGCPTLQRMAERHPERVIGVDWGTAEASSVQLAIDAHDRPLIARDLTNAIAQAGAALESIDMRGGRTLGRVTVRVRDIDHLSQLVDTLRAVPGVRDARRQR